MDEIRFKGWKVTGSKFALSKDQADMAGAFDLSIPDARLSEGVSAALGVVTSNARRRQTRLVVGGTVAVCSNGFVSGEVVLTRKHTAGFDLHTEITAALGSFEIKVMVMRRVVDELKCRSVSHDRLDTILLRTAREKILPWSHVGLVDETFRNPTYKEFKPRTAWSLMNAFTLVVKRSPPLDQMDKMNRFRKVLLP
jgi:hypothetical protein